MSLCVTEGGVVPTRVEVNARTSGEIARIPEVIAALLDVSRQIAAEATSLAHREAYDPASAGPHYADQIDAVTYDGPQGTTALVRANDFKSVWIEFGVHPGGGTTLVPGRHILLRAADAAGYPAGGGHR